VITQSYNSTPEKQLMRGACSFENRIHANKRSRLATTGRNTLARTIPKVEQADLPALGDVLEPASFKRMCLKRRESDHPKE
jgi:hypothetical protein